MSDFDFGRLPIVNETSQRELRPNLMSNFYRNYGKRLFDLSVAVPALIVFSPILAITAFLVRIYLGSPVLFRQERPGRNGRLFRICKFRSMTDARGADGNLLGDDQRLTRFGQFLRSSSLDELPELWNVVIGQMSLVGPRPLKVRYLPLYSEEQSRRHDVTPGITGWAQVNGRNSVAWEERFQLDVWYVDNLSFWLDVEILFKTVTAVFGRKGINAEGHASMPDFEGNVSIDISDSHKLVKNESDLKGDKMQTATERVSVRLALEGGTPVRSGAMSPWPCFDEELIEAAAQVLRSNKVNYWTGDEGKLFEREYAEAVGANYAIALTNGTVALELALYGFGIGPGDEVIVPSRTFIASASCAVMRGATPVVADIDRDSQTLTLETIRAVVTPRTKAIIAVHLAGWPCDLDPIMEFARSRGIKVIEDCAQAHHATYKGRQVGSIGDAAAFSFCQDKIMTTGGEGGMMTTNDRELWDKCWSLKDHGKSQNAIRAPHQPHLFRWLHESFGTNWRLTEMQSAMGRILLRRLPDWVAKRRRNANTLTVSLASVPSLRIPDPPESIGHSYYKFYAFVRPEQLRSDWSRDRIVQNLQAEGISCGPGSCSEIYLEKAFDGIRPAERLPIARELGDTSLMFLVHPTLTDAEIQATSKAIKKVMEAATKAVSIPVRRAA